MFSGIVEEVGNIRKIVNSSDGKKFIIAAEKVLEDAQIGESISVSGACLTVIDFEENDFSVEATQETLRRTTLGNLKPGDSVNLEKAMRLNDRIGGHLVTGHIDSIGKVEEITEEGFSKVIKFSLPAKWYSFFVEKGSVTVEGISLTVVNCSTTATPDIPHSENDADFWFTVALIPHTMDVTTFKNLSVGDCVNIETDIIARYVVRLLGESYLPMLNKDVRSALFKQKEV